MFNNERYLTTFVQLGNEFEVDEAVQENLESLTCMLYRVKDATSVNKVRYGIFRMGKFSDAALPPNEDCLLQHIKRANYQTTIWKRATTQEISAPSPIDHEWKIDEDQEDNIDVVWMTGKCAPVYFLKIATVNVELVVQT